MDKYRHSYGKNTTYGHVFGLIGTHVPAGSIVLDLGCGHGPLAEPLVEAGYGYVGADADPDFMQELASRGFATSHFDLTDPEVTQSFILEASAGQEHGVCILLLDVLEHLARPDELLATIHQAVDDFTVPVYLVTSIPNSTHLDLAYSLLRGEWSYTAEGLLDSTHVRFFSESSAMRLLRETGWTEISSADTKLATTEQQVPDSVYSPSTNVGEFLSHLSARISSGHTDTYQFVRIHVPLRTAAGTLAKRADNLESPRPGVSVILRTMGDRTDLLAESLLSLSGQESEDFEVLIMVHTRLQARVEEVRAHVGRFPPHFSRKASVHQVVGGDRARPLNAGLDIAKGRYVTFLDDDDCVTADWVSTFLSKEGTHPGRVVRAIVADQSASRHPHGPASYELESGLYVEPRRKRFDYVDHLFANRTPICGFAVPLRAIHELGIRFNESRTVLEDWEFLLRVSAVCGVVDTGRVTSIYRRWTDQATVHSIDRALWADTRMAIIAELNAHPIVLPPGSVKQIVNLHEEKRQLRSKLISLRGKEAGRPSPRDPEGRRALREVQELQDKLSAIQASRSWRLTRPLRVAADAVKGLLR